MMIGPGLGRRSASRWATTVSQRLGCDLGPIAGAGAFPGFIGLGFVVVGLLNRSKPKA